MCLPKSVLHIKHPQITKTGKGTFAVGQEGKFEWGHCIHVVYMSCHYHVSFFEKNVDLLLIGPNDKSEEQCWEHGLYVSRLVHRCYLIKW